MASFLQDISSRAISIIYKQQKSLYDVIVCSKLFLFIPLLRENTRPKRVDNSKVYFTSCTILRIFDGMRMLFCRNPPALYRVPLSKTRSAGSTRFHELKISTFQKRLTNADFASTLWITRPNIFHRPLFRQDP